MSRELLLECLGGIRPFPERPRASGQPLWLERGRNPLFSGKAKSPGLGSDRPRAKKASAPTPHPKHLASNSGRFCVEDPDQKLVPPKRSSDCPLREGFRCFSGTFSTLCPSKDSHGLQTSSPEPRPSLVAPATSRSQSASCT